MARDISLHKTSLRGLRETNEDVERYNLNLSIDGNSINAKYAPIDFFLVCDGHGGSEVSEFIAPMLEKHFMKKNLVYPLAQEYINKIYSFIQLTIINHPKKIGKACGSTALVVIRYMNDRKKYIQIINLGDCRCVISNSGLAIPLTKDHKPFWPDEKLRIDNVNKKYGTNEKIEFYASDWRIGDLSVSRSFGDLDNTPYVTHIPDIYNYQLKDDYEFMVISCDGLTDVLENHEIINFIRDHYYNNHTELYDIPDRYPTNKVAIQNNIARKLAEYALARQSQDNVSVMIVFFVNKS